jgi:hypothetical protein
VIFNEVMCRDATRLENGLLDLDRTAATQGWLILMGVGLACATAMWLFNRWLERQERAAA